MAQREILLLGNENLYNVAAKITEDNLEKARQVVNDLHDTIDAFKSKFAYGRAIAAPQIDEHYRIVYMKFGDRQTAFINPVMTKLGQEPISFGMTA